MEEGRYCSKQVFNTEMNLYWKCPPPCLKEDTNPLLALRPAKVGVILLVSGNATGLLT
jgi:hypothetical protein